MESSSLEEAFGDQDRKIFTLSPSAPIFSMEPSRSSSDELEKKFEEAFGDHDELEEALRDHDELEGEAFRDHNELEEAFKDHDEENEELNLKFPRKFGLVKKSISLTKLVNEDEGDLDNFKEPKTDDYIDKVGKKRQRKKDDSGLEKTKKKMQDSVQNSAEMEEMWDSITNSKDDDTVIVNCPKKDDNDAEIEKLFSVGKKKRKAEKNKAELAIKVEQVMAKLEMAVEDDITLNIEGKPAINKLMKLPLLNEVLSKKNLQTEFLDHGILNLLKSWLEPLPDGSLPSINIRTDVLKNLNDLCINLNQESRKEQLIQSGLAKVIMFLSKSDEETTSNRRLANDLVNKWSRMIYNKNMRYEKMYSQEENEENEQMLLRRENKIASKVSETKAAIHFDTDVLLSKDRRLLSELRGHRREAVGRVQIPKASPMDFKIRPKSKMDKGLKRLVKMQMDDSYVHEKIMDKLKRSKKERLQAFTLSVDGRTFPKY